MGKLFSRFWVTETPWQKLEQLESQIKSLEQDRRFTEAMYRNIIKCIMLFLVMVYVLCIILYFSFYGFSNNLDWLYVGLLPAILLIGLMTILRSITAWCLKRRQNQTLFKLIQLKAARSKILEHVRNTETYMVAKPILDRFDSKDTEPLEPNSWRELP